MIMLAALPLFQDLEEFSQDFVLETKKIKLAEYPIAFNPGIVRWKGMLLMSFRIIPDRKKKYDSEIGIVILNDNFEPISTPQLLNLRDEDGMGPCRAEDARLIVFKDRLFMIYDDNIEIALSKGGFRMHIAELYYTGEHFLVATDERLTNYEGESRDIREKAWTPFLYDDTLLLAYSLSPHLIFSPRLDGSGTCDTVVCTPNSPSWDFGLLRGGTPALLENDQYLGFFHSSKVMATAHSNGTEILHYFMGAYTCANHPPFAMTSISPYPIIGKNFYHGIDYIPYFKPIRCIFPCGYISNENYIWISYGRDDHECWIAKLDKRKLLESLVPVSTDW